MEMKDELRLLYDAYIYGEKKRGASDKIKGFLYQDYIVINCLLRDDVTRVWSECIEDVAALLDNGSFEIIQSKYYEKSDSIDVSSISKDLYYQFLSSKVLHSKLDVKPQVHYFTKNVAVKPSKKEMIKILNLSTIPDKSPYPLKKDARDWMKNNIYILKNKEQRAEALFGAMASNESISDFLDQLDFCFKSNFNQYRENLLDELKKKYVKPAGNDYDSWGKLLFGLSITYAQTRYAGKLRSFNKKSFDHHMRSIYHQKNEQTIISYMIGVINELFDSIATRNDLTPLNAHMLQLICENTIVWITSLCNTIDGEYQLFNTISKDEANKIAEFKSLPAEDRLTRLISCTVLFETFLKYMWKIMLDLCQDQITDENQLIEKSDLCNPETYLDSKVTDYICFNFPEDRYSDHSAILPPVIGDLEGSKRKIIERMLKTSVKPERWCLNTRELKVGENYYSYNTGGPIEKYTVVTPNDNIFYIECMQCISIGEGKWNINDNCNDCIFKNKCIREGDC